MNQNIFEKIVFENLLEGEMIVGNEIGVKVNQTLTQDALGPMVYLQFEALGIEKVFTELSVSYVDHLMGQFGPANADVHKYLSTVADKYGIVYSKPGNGICHQVHLERFSKPGKILIGSDSHTVTSGAIGMLAMGAGGLDVSVAMGGYPFYFKYPKIVRINLVGKLNKWVSSKDIALEILRRITTKGNVGTVLEYGGSALQHLTISDRATIANMGAETGVTTSIFPSDGVTRKFFIQQGRLDDWSDIDADENAKYEKEITIDLSKLEPLVALPYSPDNVKKVNEVRDLRLDQVLIGSCTNSSYNDLTIVSKILKGKKINSNVSLGVAPGSRQVLNMLAESGALSDIIASGARILETGCGFCVGQGQAPQNNGVSLRTNNRNYLGRSGTLSGQIYLVSPEVAAVSAITGVLTDPTLFGMEYPDFKLQDKFSIDDSLIIYPTMASEIYRSEFIGDPPFNSRLPTELLCEVAIKVGDKITTDDIIPAGRTMDFRGNIEKSTKIIFKNLEKQFFETCRRIRSQNKFSIIIAGDSYGQGSSREHAAVCPMAMGVKVVIAKSIERIHEANLVNFGIIPLIFKCDNDYDLIEKGDQIRFKDLEKDIYKSEIYMDNISKKRSFAVCNTLTDRQIKIILKGGLLNYVMGNRL